MAKQKGDSKGKNAGRTRGSEEETWLQERLGIHGLQVSEEEKVKKFSSESDFKNFFKCEVSRWFGFSSMVLDTPTGVFKSMDGKRFINCAGKGKADLHSVIGGVSFAFEAKSIDGGRQSKDQKMYEKAFKLAGGHYFIVNEDNYNQVLQRVRELVNK